MLKRDVSAHLDVEVTAPSTLEFQIAVAPHPGAALTEELTFTLDGTPVQATEVEGDHGNRIHLLDCPAGHLLVHYRASVVGTTAPAPVTARERIVYQRPSRYAEADKFYGYAATEFGAHTDPEVLLPRIASWVGARLDYVPGSSDPIDGAVDTLLAGSGVCRDYAHLVVAMLRALGIPARLVAVYPPGCDPMDFHAVAEAAVDGVWRVVDATLLAPRSTMVRIATGRDAADTAFLTNHGGAITLNNMEVSAVVDGAGPVHDIDALVSLG